MKKKPTTVINLCAPRTHSPYFTFISMGNLVLNYARSSGKHLSHKMREHCTGTFETNHSIKSPP